MGVRFRSRGGFAGLREKGALHYALYRATVCAQAAARFAAPSASEISRAATISVRWLNA